MPELPARPDVRQLRRQARELLRAARDGEPYAVRRLREVSGLVNLSAAQLAVAREYGFPNWLAMRTEAEHRRSLSERWSFGGAAPIEIAAGTLSPTGLIVAADRAVLEAALMPSQEPRRPRQPVESRQPATAAVPAGRPRFDDVSVIDDRGHTHTLTVEEMSVPSEQPADAHLPIALRLRLDPVPRRECEWLELRSHQKNSSTRLTPSARADVMINHDQWDGYAPHHLDVAAVLPSVDGTVIRLDSLFSEPDSWRIHLRATPGWWTYSEDQRTRWATVSVQAQDDLGGLYQTGFAGCTGYGGYDELILRFTPRLDPLAHSVKLTFTGSSEEATADVGLLASRPA